jgi:hypothetical protein
VTSVILRCQPPLVERGERPRRRLQPLPITAPRDGPGNEKGGERECNPAHRLRRGKDREQSEQHSEALGEAGRHDKRDDARLAPRRDALPGVQDARLAVEVRGREERRDPDEKRGLIPRCGKPRAEQERRDDRLARHPRAPEVGEDARRAQVAADLEEHAEEARRDQRETRKCVRPVGGRGRERGRDQEAGAAAAADEVAGRTQVPVALDPGFDASRSRRSVAHLPSTM